MSNLVFVSGDYCSGSTLLFTLFRKTKQYYCLYEPLHELLLEYLIWPISADTDDHHFFVENYHAELKGFDKIPVLFNPAWGNSGLHLPVQAEADELYRYLTYLLGTAFGRGAKVMLKENRLAFRLGWLKSKFPQAKIIHIHRKKEDQWKSNVRRAQAWLKRQDVGQGDVAYNGFGLAAWCEDLKGIFPELAAAHSRTGYERFCKLWDLSFAEHQRYADLSVDYGALTHDFENTCERIWSCIGAIGIDTAALNEFMVPPEKNQPVPMRVSGLPQRARRLLDRAGRKYARMRVQASRPG